MEELANIVGLPSFYFQRSFKRPVNKPIQEHVKSRRLARVIENVDSTEQRIPDVALGHGLAGHVNLARAFKKTYGITSEEYRRDLPMLNTSGRLEISMNCALVGERVPLAVGNIVLEIQRKTSVEPEVYPGLEMEVRVSEQIPAGESIDVDAPGQLWKRYHMEKTPIAANANTNVETGMSHTQDTAQSLFIYFVGSLIQNTPHHQQERFVKKELAAGDYIICRVEAESFEDLVTDALN